MSDIILMLLVLFMLIMSLAYKSRYGNILSLKKSSEVRLGQIAEHLMPFLNQFKYDPKKAKFLGMPVDYIVFEDDGIIFVEIKTGKSKLSKSQQRIKDHIKNGRVSWEEITLTTDLTASPEAMQFIQQQLKPHGQH